MCPHHISVLWNSKESSEVIHFKHYKNGSKDLANVPKTLDIWKAEISWKRYNN
jgi:hypothetical protein